VEEEGVPYILESRLAVEIEALAQQRSQDYFEKQAAQQAKRRALVALAEADHGDDEEETNLIQPCCSTTSEVVEQSKSVAALPGFDLSSYPSSSSPPRESEPDHSNAHHAMSQNTGTSPQGVQATAGVHFAITEVSREDGQWSAQSSVRDAPQVLF
jgi:hypothetical protein